MEAELKKLNIGNATLTVSSVSDHLTRIIIENGSAYLDAIANVAARYGRVVEELQSIQHDEGNSTIIDLKRKPSKSKQIIFKILAVFMLFIAWYIVSGTNFIQNTGSFVFTYLSKQTPTSTPSPSPPVKN